LEEINARRRSLQPGTTINPIPIQYRHVLEYIQREYQEEISETSEERTRGVNLAPISLTYGHVV